MPGSQSNEISAEELKIILKVIEKDEEVLNQEDKFINSLKEKLTFIRDFSLTPDEEAKNVDSCVRCKATLSWARRIFNPLLICSFCNRRICYNCNTAAKSQSPLCIYCSVLRQIEGATGAWFFKGKGATEIETLNGTYVLKNKLLHSPKQKDIRKQKYGLKTQKSIDTHVASILEEYKPENSKPFSSDKPLEDKNKIPIEQTKMPTTTPVSQSQTQSTVIQTPQKLPEIKSTVIPSSQRLPEIKSTASPKLHKLSETSPSKEIKEAPLQRTSSFKMNALSPPPANKPPSASLDNIRIDTPNKNELSPLSAKGVIPEIQPTDKRTISVTSETINKSNPEYDATMLEKVYSGDSVKKSTSKEENTPISVKERVLSDSGTLGSIPTISSSKKMPSSSINNGALCGSIKYEKSAKDTLKLKIKVSEAMGLKPLSNETSVNSYVIVRITQGGNQLFKEKTSEVKDCSAPIWNEIFDINLVSSSLDNLVIYLLILRPEKKNILKMLAKQPKDLDNNYYGSVRIGLANYISQEEQKLFKKLKSNVENNIKDWLDFNIELNRVEPRLSQTEDISFPEEDLASSMKDVSSKASASVDFLKADDLSSFQSVSSQFYGSDPINGKIYVGLKYSDNVFSVDVVKAEGLVIVGKSQASKIYAKCKMLSNLEQPSKKTTIAKKTLNPVWNSSFIFHIDTSNMCSNCLSITVFNSEPLKKKTFSGEALIPIGSMIDSNKPEIKEGYSEWFDLSPKVPHGLFGFKGVLSVSLRYDPISYDGLFGNLEVRIPIANNIQLNPNKFEPIDTYVRSMLLPNTDKKECRKSQIITKSNNPEYKFSFSFYNVSRDELRNNRCLEISVWTKSSKFIGGIRLCSKIPDTFIESWQDSSEVESNLWRSMLAKDREWTSASIPLRFSFISQNIYPSLTTNVNKIWNDYMRQNGSLRFRATYDCDKNMLVLEIKELLGLILENFSLVCYIKLRSRGPGLKREFHFLEQSCPNQWNKCAIFSDISDTDMTTIEIRLLAQKLQSSNKKSGFKSEIKSNSTIIGHILLSKGLTKEPWDTPTADEIELYNLIITTPNVWHSKDMPLNIFTRATKKVQMRTKNSSKSVVRQAKSISRINDLYPTSTSTKNNFFKIDTGENATTNTVQMPIIDSKVNFARRKSMVNIFKKPDSASKTNTNELAQSSLTLQASSSSTTKDSVDFLVTDKSQLSTSTDKSDSCKEIKVPIDYKSNEILIHPIETIPVSLPTNIPKQNQTVLPKTTDIVTFPVPSDNQKIVASNKVQMTNSPNNTLTPLINQIISQEIPFKGIESADFLQSSLTCINLCQSIPRQAFLSMKSSTEAPLLADNFIMNNFPRESPYSNLAVRAVKNNPNSYSLSIHNHPKKAKENLSIRGIKNSVTGKSFTLENVSAEFPHSKSIHYKNDHAFPSVRCTFENIPRECSCRYISHNTIIPRSSSLSLIDFSTQQKVSRLTSVDNKSNPIINKLAIINLPKRAPDNYLPYKVAENSPVKNNTPSQILDQQQNIPKNVISSPSVVDASKASVSSTSVSMPEKEKSNSSSNSNLPSISETPISSIHDVSDNLLPTSTSEQTSTEASKLPAHDRKKSDGDSSLTAQSQTSESAASVKSNSKIDLSRQSFVDQIPRLDSKVFKRVSTISYGEKNASDRDDCTSDSISVYGVGKVSGDILIGFRYITVRNQLTVTIKKASNLSANDQKRKIDPYVKVHMLPEKSKLDKFKTKAIKNSLNPSWDENFTFTYNTADLKLRKLAISVWHHQIRKKIFLGEVVIPIGETVANVIKKGYTESWYNLEEKSKSAEIISEELPVGQLEIGLCLEKNELPTPSSTKKTSKKSTLDSILKLKIIEGKDIATLDPVGFALCKIYLQPDKSHKTKKKTVQAENKSGRYIWNAEIDYEVDSAKIQDNGLEIKIRDSKKKKHKIGSVHLNNGSKNGSWQDATSEEADIWKLVSTNIGIYQNFIVQLRPDKKSSK